MDPVTGAVALTAAAAGVIGSAAIGAYTEIEAANVQGIVDQSNITLETEAAKFAAAREAEQHSRNFRSALASQVAMSSFRGGSGSLTRQFGAESFGNFLKDQESFKRGLRIRDIQASTRRAEASAMRSARKTAAITGFAKTAATTFLLAGGGAAAGATASSAAKAQAAMGPGVIA